MKDATHHLRNIQRKVIRSSRREEEMKVSSSEPNATGVAMLEPEEMSAVNSKRSHKNELPKKMKTRTYH